MSRRYVPLLAVLFVLSATGLGCPTGDSNPDPDGGQPVEDAGPGGLCEAGASEACACGDLSGTRVCADDGEAWGACECPPVCTESAFSAAGDVEVEGRLLDVDAAQVTAEAKYAPEGCVTRATWTITLSSGCSLALTFGPYQGTAGGLLQAELTSLSCPGLPTGTYRSVPVHGAWWWRGPSDMPTGAAGGACVENAVITFPSRDVRLASESSGAQVTLRLDHLVLAGDWFATEDPAASCVDARCAEGLHDGGLGWCLLPGDCAVGFQDGGDGSCVPEGTCADGYHDDGLGGCLPPGECAAGRHDDGTGTCVDEGQCAEGWRLGDDGTCVALVPCSEGVSLSSSRLDFTSVRLGESSALSFDLTNPAEFDPCSVARIHLGPGTDTAFSLTAGEERDVLLAPGETHAVEVAFAPAVADAVTGLAAIQLGDGALEMVRLAGRGTDLEATITPEVVDFGSAVLGCAPLVQQVCVANTGSEPFILDAVRLSVSESFGFESTPVAPTSVTPGASRCFGVTFTPPAQGNYVATLTFQIGADVFPVAVHGIGQGPATGTESFVQADGPKADVIFVIDDSGSMQEEQNHLAGNAQSIIDGFVAAGIDYHIGVVSTDVSHQGALLTAAAGGPAFVSAASAAPATELAANIQLGTYGSATEQGLQSAWLAVTEPALSGANAGFIRADAYLAMVFLSDEQDQSPGLLTDYLFGFRAVHGGATDRFLASAIVGDAPSGCDSTYGSAWDAGTRYIYMADETGGVFTSICAADWSPAYSSLIPSMTELPRIFPLAGAPRDGSVAVTIERVDGTVYTPVDWTYDAATSALVFTDPPAAGETILVSYTAACEG